VSRSREESLYDAHVFHHLEPPGHCPPCQFSQLARLAAPIHSRSAGFLDVVSETNREGGGVASALPLGPFSRGPALKEGEMKKPNALLIPLIGVSRSRGQP
jgi:hypothetical protein